jgi:hypothetical protein
MMLFLFFLLLLLLLLQDDPVLHQSTDLAVFGHGKAMIAWERLIGKRHCKRFQTSLLMLPCWY